MTETMSELIESTILYLNGFTSQQDPSTYLTENLTASALEVNVNDASAIGRGIIEIDNEIMQVEKVDRQSNILTVPPYGRGFRGTQALQHEAGVRVAGSPQFPRHSVRQALHDAIRAVYPDVYATADQWIPSEAVITDYPLSHLNARHVLKVTAERVGPTQEWLPIRRYELKPYKEGGMAISIYDRPVPGFKIHVRTAGTPFVPEDDTELFSETGLPDSAMDLVRLGAAYRLVPNVETPLLSGLSAQADFASNMRPVGAGQNLGKYILGLYRERLMEVRRQQQQENPIRAHYER